MWKNHEKKQSEEEDAKDLVFFLDLVDLNAKNVNLVINELNPGQQSSFSVIAFQYCHFHAEFPISLFFPQFYV